MPPFAPPQSQDGQAWEPPAADSRLAKTAGASPSGVFTSDLSVSEYVLLGEAGFEPLGFVVGSSIYHVGLQVGRWGRNQELQVLTQAMYNAREFAMARMRAKADHLGADGIVGVQLRMQMYAWGQRLPGVRRHRHRGRATWPGTARTARPTAGRSPRTCPPRTSSGCWPRARCRSRSSSAPASTTSHTGACCSRLRQAYQNQEMLQFTQGVYEARELALDRMQAEAAQVGASGIVGVTVEVKNHVWGEHATEFLATGTAVRRLAAEHKLPETTPKPTFTLGLDH